MAWKVYFREGELADGSRPYILLLVEFQSTADRDMARRVREYTGMLLDRLIRNDVMAREGGLPRTLAVVVYNGGERWTAIGEESHLAEVPSELAERDLALLQPQLYRRIDTGRGAEQDWPKDNLVAATARLQSAATPDEIGPRLLAEARRFPEPARQAFRRALHAWARKLWIDKMGPKRPFHPSRNWSRRSKRWQPLYRCVGPDTTPTCVPKSASWAASWVVQTSVSGAKRR